MSAPDVAAEASDPHTPLARLAEIAAAHPEFRAAVAANPSTYPELRAWIAAQPRTAAQGRPRRRRTALIAVGATAAIVLAVVVALVVVPVATTASRDARVADALLTPADVAELPTVPAPRLNITQPLSAWVEDRREYLGDSADPSCYFASASQFPFAGTETRSNPGWDWNVTDTITDAENVSFQQSVRAFPDAALAELHLVSVATDLQECTLLDAGDGYAIFEIRPYPGDVPPGTVAWIESGDGYETLNADILRGDLVTRITTLGVPDEEFVELLVLAADRLRD